MHIESIQNGYIAGVCNIGKEERAMRTRAGIVGALISIAVAVVFIAIHVSWPLRLLLFIPAFGSAVGLIQSAFHFCVRFGASGVFNFSPDVGHTQNVADPESRQKDMAKVRLIILLSALSAAVFTTIVAIIP